MSLKQRLAMIVGGIQTTRETYTAAALSLNNPDPELAEKAREVLEKSEKIFSQWQEIVNKEVEELLAISGPLPSIAEEESEQ